MDLRDFDPWACDEKALARGWPLVEPVEAGEEPADDAFEADIAVLARRERRALARLRGAGARRALSLRNRGFRAARRPVSDW